MNLMKHLSSWCFCLILIETKFLGAATNEDRLDIDVFSSGKVVTILPNSSIIVHASNVRPEVTSIVFEAHTQRDNITLSYNEQPLLHNSVTGKNVGLTVVLSNNISNAHMWLISQNSQNISALVKLIAYTSEDPVPGGCNMEFPIEIAPYLRLTDDQFSTRLEFQHANIGFPKDADPPPCSSTINYFSYSIYAFYLKEHSYSEDEYFKGIQDMSNISFLYSHAKKLHTHAQHPETRADFLKYPKTGVVYNVMAKYSADGILREAAYVPSATYGCILISEDLGCGLPYTNATKPLLLILSIFGLFIAFFGHKCFTAEVFFFGFLLCVFVSFILISRYDRLWEEQSTLVFTLTLGLLGGIVSMLIWLIVFRPIISVLPVGLVLGFLLTATLLYTPIGNHEMFMNDKIYWMFISGSTAIITVILLAFPKALSIVGSSVVGSYASILFLDNYLGSSLIFIVINVIKRALAKQAIFAAINDFPFETNNIIVCSLWLAICVLSAAVQIYMNWRKRNFPTPFCTCLKVKYPGCTCSSGMGNYVIHNIPQTNATEPLLSQNVVHHTYNTMN